MALQLIQSSHVLLAQLKAEYVQVGGLSLWLDRLGQGDEPLLEAPSYQDLHAGRVYTMLHLAWSFTRGV